MQLRIQQSQSGLSICAVLQISQLFPPKHLFTVTVGRNRSKARFAVTTSSDVADMLDSLVQQGIYQREPTPHGHTPEWSTLGT